MKNAELQTDWYFKPVNWSQRWFPYDHLVFLKLIYSPGEGLLQRFELQRPFTEQTFVSSHHSFYCGLLIRNLVAVNNSWPDTESELFQSAEPREARKLNRLIEPGLHKRGFVHSIQILLIKPRNRGLTFISEEFSLRSQYTIFTHYNMYTNS